MIEAKLELNQVVINGLVIIEPLPVKALHDVLGSPDRIVDPAEPAPVGHRNNQIHVYDSAGIYFYEHHFTRLAMAIDFVLWPEEQTYKFTPATAFGGRLILAGYEVPSGVSERDLARNTQLPWVNYLKGRWSIQRDGFSIGFAAIGQKLKSGRRSTSRRVVSINASWPHDPWRGQKLDRQMK